MSCANKVQRLLHRFLSRRHLFLYRAAIEARRGIHHSSTSRTILRLVSIDESAHYSPPGVRQTSEKFLAALQQTTMYCGETFRATDCLMLGALIRHRSCRVIKIVFFDVDGQNPNFEFDVLPSLNANKSVRSLSIIGGKWSEGFLIGLVKLIQVDNPAITDLSLENITLPSRPRANLLSRVGELCHDYFNYSAPGISHISLHGMQVGDGLLEDLIKGLAVNTSLKHLELSANGIEDSGVLSILAAINKNDKCGLTCLDLSHNFITLKKLVREELYKYRPMNVLIVLKVTNSSYTL